MFAEIADAGVAALGLYENRKSVLAVLRRLRRRILRGTWRVPVFGDGGTGKTTLGKFLAGELDTDVAIEGYRESIRQEEFSLPGGVPCVLLVPPGQRRRRPYSWPALYRLLSRGKAAGLINVVSWGHRSTELEYKRHEVYRKGIRESAYRRQFLEYNRRGEITALNELAPHLEATKQRIWMVTLVTKQDLWWPQRHEVKEHYERGEYGQRIQSVIGAKGVEEFVHEYYSVSLVPQNLATADGRALARTAAGYDQPLRVANLARFAQALNDLLV